MRTFVLLLAFFLLLPSAHPAMGQGRGSGAVAMKGKAAEDSLSTSSSAVESSVDKQHLMIFAAFAEGDRQLYHTLVLSESIRTFGGQYSGSPIRIYVPESRPKMGDWMLAKFSSLNAEIMECTAPAEALEYYYARKVFAAAAAEAEAEDKAEVLVWMDEDTIILQEPLDFDLDDGISFGYRPVMHQLIASLYSEPPDKFWSRLYETFSIPDSAIFSMMTPADLKIIRAYFNAGLLVVRPERGILRKWAEYFPKLYQDPFFTGICEQDLYRIFLHQTALVGAVLNTLQKEELVQLSERYNYPIFFKEMFGAEKDFHSIEDVITLRYDVYFRNPEPDWSQKLKGPAEKIAWLKERLDR